MRMAAKLYLPVLAVAALAMAGGCETNSPNSPAANTNLNGRTQTALQQMTAQDPHLQDMLNNSVGYVIFSDMGSAAVGIGGASGEGVLYQNGQQVGTVKVGQVSVGPQVGGESYSELIVFQNENSLNRLKNNSLEFGAEANATIIKAGADASTQFSNGMAIFVLPKGGLMAGANINGQKFTYYGGTQGQ